MNYEDEYALRNDLNKKESYDDAHKHYHCDWCENHYWSRPNSNTDDCSCKYHEYCSKKPDYDKDFDSQKYHGNKIGHGYFYYFLGPTFDDGIVVDNPPHKEKCPKYVLSNYDGPDSVMKDTIRTQTREIS